MNLNDFIQNPNFDFEYPASLYIHIPFCAHKCAYCDFHSLPLGGGQTSRLVSYSRDLARRIAAASPLIPQGLRTIYIGGGTPTVLDPESLAVVLGALKNVAGPDLKEWTVEANPESLDARKLDILAEAGVTRISLGIQSMNAWELAVLGRSASPEANLRALSLARTWDLAVSADLIGGIPFSPSAPLPKRLSLAEQASIMLGQGISHISIYDLTVEASTPLAERLRSGELVLPLEDMAQDERKDAEKFLAERNFNRYEVSNFAPAGNESIHNGVYWAMDSYLGIGSSAVSTLIGRGRPEAIRIEEDSAGDIAISEIGARDSAFEFVMMGLRTARGLSLSRFASRFGSPLLQNLRKTLESFRDRFTITGDFLALDDRGLDILNAILLSVLDDMDDLFAQKDSSP
jgi:oxygen-independent coproporphyrinogen-3 oxidase